MEQFTKDMHIIAKLDDQPNDVGGLTAAQLKDKFDEGGVAIKEYINNVLLPAMGQICVVTALPKGRAKGDVDADGLVSESDAELAVQHYVGNITLTGEETLWAADTYGDDDVDVYDATVILEYANGILDQYSQYAADYYGNWKWDGEKGCYYYDIPISEMAAGHSAVVMLATAVANNVLIDAQCIERAVRIHARGIPTHEVTCSVLCSTSPGGAMILNGKDGHTPVKGVDYFTEEDRAEMVAQVIAAVGAGYITVASEDDLPADAAEGTVAIVEG